MAGPDHCSDGADIAFIVDSSKLSAFNYGLEKNFVKQTMRKLAEKSARFNAAIVVYNDEATVELNFTRTFQLNHFLYFMDSLAHKEPKNASLTRIDIALQVTSDYVFGPRGGYRLDAAKIAVLLTQGVQDNTLQLFQITNASKALKEKGVRILVVVIGSKVYQLRELRDLTSTEIMHDTCFPFDPIKVNGFTSLRDFEDILVETICSAIGKYTHANGLDFFWEIIPSKLVKNSEKAM